MNRELEFLSTNATAIITTISTHSPPLSHVSVLVGYICLVISTLLWGTFYLPVKHYGNLILNYNNLKSELGWIIFDRTSYFFQIRLDYFRNLIPYINLFFANLKSEKQEHTFDKSKFNFL